MKAKALLLSLMLGTFGAFAQDEVPTKDNSPVKDAFESNWLINGQTTVVPPKGTLESDISHSFGTMKNGLDDMYGLYASSNIRLGLTFVVMKGLQFGTGMTKDQKMHDFNIKYNILKQTKSNSIPVFVTFVGNTNIETLPDEKYTFDGKYEFANRVSYFGQLLVARRINSAMSVQAGVSLSHYNVIDNSAATYTDISNNTLGLNVGARYKFSPQSSVLIAYDMALNGAKEVKPNASIGYEVSTGSHAFQIHFSPYRALNSQRNYVFNINDYTTDGMALGFTITRMWGL